MICNVFLIGIWVCVYVWQLVITTQIICVGKSIRAFNCLLKIFSVYVRCGALATFPFTNYYSWFFLSGRMLCVLFVSRYFKSFVYHHSGSGLSRASLCRRYFVHLHILHILSWYYIEIVFIALFGYTHITSTSPATTSPIRMDYLILVVVVKQILTVLQSYLCLASALLIRQCELW